MVSSHELTGFCNEEMLKQVTTWRVCGAPSPLEFVCLRLEHIDMKSLFAIRHRLPLFLSSTTLLCFVLMGSACLESTITETCTTMAAQRCETCYQCAEDVDLWSGGTLCNVGATTNKAACTEKVVEVCEDQTNAR